MIFIVVFYTKKNQSRRGASIREIKKLFSLKPSIVGDNQGKGKIFAEKGWGTAAGKNLKCSFRVRDKKPCKCIHAVVPTVCIRGVGSFVCSRGEGTLCVKMGFYEDKMQNEVNPIPTCQRRNQPLYERHVTKSGKNRVKRILVNFKSRHLSALCYFTFKNGVTLILLIDLKMGSL